MIWEPTQKHPTCGSVCNWTNPRLKSARIDHPSKHFSLRTFPQGVLLRFRGAGRSGSKWVKFHGKARTMKQKVCWSGEKNLLIFSQQPSKGWTNRLGTATVVRRFIFYVAPSLVDFSFRTCARTHGLHEVTYKDEVHSHPIILEIFKVLTSFWAKLAENAATRYCFSP